jgi:radical SAM protein (TIGR01212 family)
MVEPYRTFNSFLKLKFPGQKVRKIPINAGFSCPNKDGLLSSLGCIFCDEYGSGPIQYHHIGIRQQIEDFINHHPGKKYIAYYQAYTNTYAPVEELKKKYEIIFSYQDILGLFIGTRPDAIENETYELLKELNRKTYLSVELGLQSVHNKSLSFLNRNHSYSQFLETFSTLKAFHIDTVVHLIIGIPGESFTDMLANVKEMNRLKPAGIKFHLLHILENTTLYRLFKQNQIQLMTIDQYIETMIYLLEHLDPSIVIHRITGEREPELFVAPGWALNKINVINRLKSKMVENRIVQGDKLIKRTKKQDKAL